MDQRVGVPRREPQRVLKILDRLVAPVQVVQRQPQVREGVGIVGSNGHRPLERPPRLAQPARGPQRGPVVVVVHSFGGVEFEGAANQLDRLLDLSRLLPRHAQQVQSAGVVGPLAEDLFVPPGGLLHFARLVPRQRRLKLAC